MIWIEMTIMAEIFVEVSLSRKHVEIRSGSEIIAADVKGNRVHIWATTRSGGRTIASLEFRGDEVALLGN
jgi:hypothetical protein